jgi:hypothetical protein
MNAPSKTIRNNTEIVFIGLAGKKNPEIRLGAGIQVRLRRVSWLAREGPATEGNETHAPFAKQIARGRQPGGQCKVWDEGASAAHD